MNNNAKTVLIKISGKVQGVWFRATAKEEADAVGLTGWVRNENDGSVLILAHGTDEQLKAFEAWCHEGPNLARVDSVDVSELNENPPSGGFYIEYSF